MNLRTYLLLLRPARTFAAALLSLLAFTVLFVALAGRLSPAKYLAILGCFAGPFIVGSQLIGPLFEAAHRSSFPLLPDAIRQFLRWHLAAYLFAAVALFGLVALSRMQIPAPAALGAILLSLALPLLDPTNTTASRTHWRFGLLSSAGLALVCLGEKPLFAVLQDAPWAVLVGGAVAGMLCFRFGFAPHRLRARNRHPLYFAPQTTIVFAGTDMLHYQQTEAAREAEQGRSSRGAHWTAITLRDRFGDWLRAIRFARHGKSRWMHSDAMPCVITGVVVVILLYSIAPEKPSAIKPERTNLEFAIVAVAAYVAAIANASSAAVPAYRFPLSRRRLANVHFAAFARRAIAALLGAGVGTVAGLLSFGGVAHSSIELPRLVISFGLVPLALNLSLAALFLHDAFFRFVVWFAVLAGFLAALGIAAMTPVGGFGIGGLVLYAGCLAFSVWLVWLSLQTHYRTCDLNTAGDWLRRLGFGNG